MFKYFTRVAITNAVIDVIHKVYFPCMLGHDFHGFMLHF